MYVFFNLGIVKKHDSVTIVVHAVNKHKTDLLLRLKKNIKIWIDSDNMEFSGFWFIELCCYTIIIYM